MQDRSELIPLSLAASESGLSHPQLRLLARSGRLRAVKIGRDWLTTREAVEAYLADDEALAKTPFKRQKG